MAFHSETFQEGNNGLNGLKKLILTGEAFAASNFVESGESVYRYRIEGENGKVVYFFGGRHTSVVGDPMFAEISEEFGLMNPDMVMVEGMHGIEDKDRVVEGLNERSWEDAQALGEPMYTLKLAVERITLGNEVDFESPEPKLSEEIRVLEEMGYERSDIFTFYYYRDVEQFLRQYPQRTPELLAEYLAPFIENFRSECGWGEQECMQYEELYGGNVDIVGNRYSSLVDPIQWPEKSWTITNQISAASSQIRDEYILERIARALEHHDKVFVVYGSTHGVKLEPALRALMEGPRS